VDAKRLEAVGLFAMLSRSELERIGRWIDELDVPAGKELTREGAIAHEFFVIEEGEASVRQEGEEIGTLGPGDFFGEIALLEDTPRTATVVAKTPLRFFVLTRRSFRSLLAHQPALEQKVLAALEERVRATSESS